jgi:hypothetical protein
MHTCTSVGWKWAPSILKWKSFWNLEFRSVLNLWDKNVNNKLSPQYIIVNVLKCKYQKWIQTLQYLEYWVESYGQKKSHESNSQFDSWPLKPRNMDQMTFDRGVQHVIGKILSKITTL